MNEAEEKKELGNKAFAAQDFEKAIKHYSEAIQMDKTNHVYYSNRSASYAGERRWTEASMDAKECIKLNPSFLKGYYRLATAQIELNELDSAMATIKQGLHLEPDNSQLTKQLRIIKAKKASKQRDSNIPRRNAADSTVSKEVIDLQQQLQVSSREYNVVSANISKAEKEKKMNELTKSELEQISNDSKMYRGIGKMFLLSSRNDVFEYLDQSVQEDEKKLVDLTQKKNIWSVGSRASS